MKLSIRNSDRKVESDSLTAYLILTVIALIVFGWSLFTPPFASVDEPAHAARSYAAVHGQAFVSSNRNEPPTYVSLVKVPNWINPQNSNDGPFCFWGKRNITADCAQNNWKDVKYSESPNQFLQYFPTFATVAGLPSLVLEGKHAYYAMRIFGSFLFLCMSAIYLWSCLQRKQPKQMYGLFLFLTPMTFSGAGTLAPIALETISAVTFLSLLRNRLGQDQMKKRKLETYLLLFTATTLLTSRPSGILWLLIAMVISLSDTIKDLRSKISANKHLFSLISSISILDVLYLYFHRPPTGQNLPVSKFNFLSFISVEIQKLGEYFNNAIGIFGMDVYLPSISYYIYAGIFFSLATFFFTNRDISKYTKLSNLFLIGLFVVLPMIVNFLYRNTFVHFWQGRYMTPLLALVVAMYIFWSKNNSKFFVLSVVSVMIITAGLLVSYIRYSNGLSPSCCGTAVRTHSTTQWIPGLLDGYWLLGWSAVTLILFFVSIYVSERLKTKLNSN